MGHIRTVKTASGARAVQIVHSKRGRSKDIEHIGSAHTDSDYEMLLAAARQRLAGGQGQLDWTWAMAPPWAQRCRSPPPAPST